MQGGPDKLIYYAVHKLAVVPAAGGPARVLTQDLDRNVLSPRFTPDGKAILFLLEDDRAVHLAKMPAAGGPIERLVGGRRVVSAFTTASDGRSAILAARPDALRRRSTPSKRARPGVSRTRTTPGWPR